MSPGTPGPEAAALPVRRVPCLDGVDLEGAAAVVLLRGPDVLAGHERHRRSGSDRPPPLLAEVLGALGLRSSGHEVRRTTAGRPYLVDAAGRPVGPSFNVSHSGSVIGVAVSARATVGLDVQEQPDDVPHRIVARWLHPDDCAGGRGRGGVSVQEFTRIWAIREARCKAAGTGLAGMRTRDPVGPGDVGDCAGVTWRVLPMQPGYCGAIAWDARPAGPVVLQDAVAGRTA